MPSNGGWRRSSNPKRLTPHPEPGRPPKKKNPTPGKTRPPTAGARGPGAARVFSGAAFARVGRGRGGRCGVSRFGFGLRLQPPLLGMKNRRADAAAHHAAAHRELRRRDLEGRETGGTLSIHSAPHRNGNRSNHREHGKNAECGIKTRREFIPHSTFRTPHYLSPVCDP